MPQVVAPISEFATDMLTDQFLRHYVSSDTLSHQAMLTEREAHRSRRAQPLADRDPSVDAYDTTEMPPWLVDVLPRLEELAGLQENWDSYGSPPPTSKLMGNALAIVQRAERLLGYSQAQPRTMPTPSIVPLSGGGIQIEWQTPVKELELEFFEERATAALAVDIATGDTAEDAFDPSDWDRVSVLLDWLMSY